MFCAPPAILRKVKSYHKSEWSLSDASALVPVLPTRLLVTQLE
jgi:hypothetical protein